MKRVLNILCVAIVAVCSLGCKGGSGTLLPTVSGKAGEVIVIMGREDWEGNLGNQVRDLLACDCPYLAQKEPLYSLVNVSPTGFGDLFKVHRNIVIFDINPQVKEAGVSLINDAWAHPQCVLKISAADSAAASEILSQKAQFVLGALEQAERDRVISNTMMYEEKSIAPQVMEIMGGSPHFPSGYVLRKKTDDFIWIADEKQYTIQGVLIYKYPATLGADEFSEANIIAHRNEFMKNNVPGMFDNTYMTTSEYIEPTVEYLKYKGREFAQTRGFWEVYNDYMGGPFVSHSFYSQDGSEVIVLDAFVYAPKYDKRHYLRQVESLLYSFEWDKEK